MKKIITIAIALLLVTPAMFASTKTEFDDALGGFLTEVTDALPDSAVVGGTWSDAYIGQLIGIPPHFGVGVAAGITRFPVKALADAIELTGQDLPVDTLILPNVAVEGRVGGFLLPFDAGLRFGMLPKMTLQDVSFQYLNFGADVRYALLKDSLVTPGISLGLGYTYTGGEIGYGFDAGALAGIDASAYGSGSASKGDLTTTFSTNVIDAKLQVSKSLLIVTPYAGLGAYMAMSNADYKIETDFGSTKDDTSVTAFGARIFGGASLNILVLKFDLGGMYDITTQNWGANLGARVQL